MTGEVMIDAACRDLPSRSDAEARLWLDPHTVRSTRLRELLEVAAGGAVVQAVGAAIIFATFWASPHRLEAGIVSLVLASFSSGLVVLQRLGFCDRISVGGVRRVFVAAQAFALALGTAWAAVPLLLFAEAGANQRLVIVAVVAAVLSEAARFRAERAVTIAYVAPICVGGLAGFAISGTGAGIALALALPFFGWYLLSCSARAGAMAAQRIADGAAFAAQSETIRTLLLDFDEEASDWLWRTDAEGRLTFASDGAGADSFGAAIDRPLVVAFTPAGGKPDDGARSVLALMAAKKPFRNRLVGIRGEADTRWLRISGKPLFDDDGAFTGYRGVCSDVSGARNSESRISYLANHDPLTGFANRTSFQAFASRQCVAAAEDGQCRALLCLDLDGFKAVNDSLGHEGGDELLKQVSARLTAAVPNETFLARIGGDEFAIWVPSTTPTRIEATANDLIAALRPPFDVNGIKVEIGGTIGIALTPKHGTDADTLLMRADLALYRGKSEGRGRAKMFAEAFETSIAERRKLEADIKLALARGEFTLHYQPLVEMGEGRVVCFEALIRWHSPERGFVSPADFIPAAESAGLISAVGRYVLLEACRAAAMWPQDVQVAVNVSPPHVRSSDFLQDVTMALKASGLHPSRLQIEVTEGVFLDRSETAFTALQTLRARGVTVALDDFGTGYSSLNYLVDFPVDKIKIDRAFVRDIVESNAHQAIVDAMLDLARKLSIRVTAEGVETKAQARALKRRRCDDIQGFLLSKARPASDVPAMIAEMPALFRQAVPTHMDSPLAMVLARKETSQAA